MLYKLIIIIVEVHQYGNLPNQYISVLLEVQRISACSIIRKHTNAATTVDSHYIIVTVIIRVQCNMSSLDSS